MKNENALAVLVLATVFRARTAAKAVRLFQSGAVQIDYAAFAREPTWNRELCLI